MPKKKQKAELIPVRLLLWDSSGFADIRERGLNDLIRSFKMNGFVESIPVVVYPVERQIGPSTVATHYVLINGRRSAMAAIAAGLKEVVAVVIREPLSDKDIEVWRDKV